jgi:hypothetical protein
LWTAQSVDTVPPLFFDVPALSHFVCVNDVCLPAKMMDVLQVLPASLEFGEFVSVTKEFQYYCDGVFHRQLPLFFTDNFPCFSQTTSPVFHRQLPLFFTDNFPCFSQTNSSDERHSRASDR